MQNLKDSPAIMQYFMNLSKGDFRTTDERLADDFIELKKKTSLTEEEQLNELFKLYQTLPDWDRFPMPEVFYKKFGVKKVKPVDNPVVPRPTYCGQKTTLELRNAVPGGVRQVEESKSLPVATIVRDEKGNIVERKSSDDEESKKLLQQTLTDETLICNVTDSSGNSRSLPKVYTNSGSQPLTDHPSQGLSDAEIGSSLASANRGAE